MLKTLADELALPVAILCRRVYRESCWPKPWKLHWIVPMFKRGSVYDPSNYRGLHLTTVLSKVAERVIGSPLVHFLQERGYGDSQWAFRRYAGAKDLVTIAVARWVLQVCQGKKVGVYLADISGAFDKVSRERLMAKLAALGVAPAFLDFLNSYLQPREGRVLVEGAFSDASLNSKGRAAVRHGVPGDCARAQALECVFPRHCSKHRGGLTGGSTFSGRPQRQHLMRHAGFE